MKEFEEKLLESYGDYLENWPYYLNPSDVQEFGTDGSGPYIVHTFRSFMEYLQNKKDGLRKPEGSYWKRLYIH